MPPAGATVVEIVAAVDQAVPVKAPATPETAATPAVRMELGASDEQFDSK
jgi:hypothetical protein